MTDRGARELVELKPCPFCGGEAERFTIGDDEPSNAGGDVISCTRCGASSHVEFGRKENLVSCWNRRALTPPEGDTVSEGAVERRVTKVTPAMQQAWVDWDINYNPEPPLTRNQAILVRIAFFDGWLAAISTPQERGDASPPVSQGKKDI